MSDSIEKFQLEQVRMSSCLFSVCFAAPWLILCLFSGVQALQALQRQPNAAQYFQQLMLQQQINNAQLQNLAAVQQVKVCACHSYFNSRKWTCIPELLHVTNDIFKHFSDFIVIITAYGSKNRRSRSSSADNHTQTSLCLHYQRPPEGGSAQALPFLLRTFACI